MWKEISGRIQILTLNISKKVSGTPRLYVETLYLLVAIRGTEERLFKLFFFIADIF